MEGQEGRNSRPTNRPTAPTSLNQEHQWPALPGNPTCSDWRFPAQEPPPFRPTGGIANNFFETDP
eukprot:11914698-Alexandrium_andersonii.AAC.1